MATVTDAQIFAAQVAYDGARLFGRETTSAQMLHDAMRAALEAAEQVRQQEMVDEAHGQPDGEPHVVGEAIVTRAGARCHARRCGDEMLCGRCGLAWLPGDEDPPKCSPNERRLTTRREVDR